TLYPVIEHLKRVMGWKPEDSAEERLEKLEAALKAQSLPPEEAVPLYAELMSLPLPEGRYAPLELGAKQKREQTFDALAGWLLEEAEQTPVLHLWEDLHWADPTTLDLLALYIEQSPTVSMMNVLTYRPEFVPPWAMRSHMTPITLNRLERPEVEALIGYQTNGKAVPSEVIEHVVGKADGVPLFVEELTKTILQSDYLREEADRYTLVGSLSAVAIPVTLQDSLMARLDRLPRVREVAQLGAVLGREFAYEMLQALAEVEEPNLRDRLGQLVDAELLYQRGRPPRAKYIFKHALIQDAAYESLLKRTRQQYHRRVAALMEERFPETEPELLARHFTEAGLDERAVEYWHQAGQRAAERSANLEAIAHLTKGLELNKGLPETPEHARRELGLHLTLGPALMAIKGWMVPEVEQAYLRARTLCRQVGEPAQLFTVTWGLWLHYQQAGQLKTAQGLADEVLALAEGQADPAFRLQAHHAAWTTHYRLAEFSACREHTEQGFALYNIDEHRSHAFLYGGHDPGVCCQVHAATSLWFLGYADQALEQAHDAVALAKRLSHPFSLTLAQLYVALVHQFRREAELAQERAEATIALCAEQGFAQISTQGAIMRGWAVAARGQVEMGIAEMHRGLSALRATGAGAHRPYFLALLSEAYGHTGQAEEGLSPLAESLDLIETGNVRTWEAELHRLKGELLLARSAKNAAEAEGCFDQAIAVARRQLAKSLELRAATSLARLWQGQGKIAEADDLLSPVYGWFTEGFETADLRDARALLDELS
ncbi:MAG: adenylate cyclase, partial [Proteobacteria bacterium]|nr:adenylate cyclase [Pseudomonadota bacterium]